MGYWGQPELTAEVLRPHPLLPPELGDAEKVCYSGDYVTMDEDGFLYFVGRRDTMIKSSGFRISPTEVEEVLFQSGLREGRRGDRRARRGARTGHQGVRAWPREGDSLDDEELRGVLRRARCRATWFRRRSRSSTTLPKTTSGKVDYPALRRREGL